MSHNSNRWLDVLGLATLVFIVVGLYMAFLYAPTEVNMGLVYRIFSSIWAQLPPVLSRLR